MNETEYPSGQPNGEPPEKQCTSKEAVDSRRSFNSLQGISLLRFVNVLLRNRWVLGLAPIAAALLFVGWALVQPASFTSSASFTPQSDEAQASRIAGLASQFGISIPQGGAGESPQFYADLLRSRELLRQTVRSEYRVATEANESDERLQVRDLVALLDVEADTRPVAVAKTIDVLRDHLGVATNPETGVVELSVTTRWPRLSRQVAERMIELVNRFNLETRRTQAEAEREFIESQVTRAESALHATEDSLEAFLERNRRFENSPELAFQHDRLQRRVNLRQQVFTSLSESYEQAKIDEVRNTPVITVIGPPEVPARADPRRLFLKGLLGLMLGGLVGVLWACLREVLATSHQTDPDEYAEFARLRAEMKGEMQELWRRLQLKGT